MTLTARALTLSGLNQKQRTAADIPRSERIPVLVPSRPLFVFLDATRSFFFFLLLGIAFLRPLIFSTI